MIEVGSVFKSKNTKPVRAVGIDPEKGKGIVVLVSNGFISFQLISGDFSMNAKTTEEIFKDNFKPTGEIKNLEPEEKPLRHFEKKFPNDF